MVGPKYVILALFLCFRLSAFGQSDSVVIEQGLHWWKTLSTPRFLGRGYTGDGVNKAAKYLVKEVKQLGALPYRSQYEQSFQLPIHYFSSQVHMWRDRKKLRVGIDFMPAADCPKVRKRPIRLVKIDSISACQGEKLAGLLDQTAPGIGFLLPNHDKLLIGRVVQLLGDRPCEGLFVPQRKFTHTLSPTAGALPIIYLKDSVARSVIDGEIVRLQVGVKEETAFPCRNVMGYLPSVGPAKDSLLVISAHYDHLGQVGDAVFCGANDNASGTAMVLSLLAYYGAHPKKRPCNMLFVFFAGEEAGLLGSKSFLEEVIGERRTQMAVLNLDLMAGGSEGLMLVNGQALPQWVERMNVANQLDGKMLLPSIKVRPNAPNSDHYWFAKAGIPAVFAYTMGGVSAYHDVHDQYQSMDTTKFGKVWLLLKRFIEGNPPKH